MAGPGGGIRLVDVDRAGLDAGGEVGSVRGRAPDTGVEAVAAVVGPSDRVVGISDAVQRDDWTERLLARQSHVVGHALEHRRLVEQGAEIGTCLGPGQNLRPLGHGIVDVAGDGVELLLTDEAPHL